MAVRNIRTIKPRIWIPPKYFPVYRITVERKDGTIDDITDLILEAEIEHGATESIGRFMFKIPNANEKYTNVWTGNEIFRYYADYSTTATTLRFLGRIEKPTYPSNDVKCEGRGELLFFVDKKVTKNYDNIETSLIIKDLFANYAPTDITFTVTNVEISIVSLTIGWTEKPFWECIEAICIAAGFDCWSDASRDIHFHKSGSKLNTAEAMVHDMNILETKDFAKDISQVRNKIKIIGAIVDGIRILYTAEDSISQSDYGVKVEVIEEKSLTTYNQVKDFGNFHLSLKKDPPQIGEIETILLASIQPAQMLRISDPQNNIPPGNYLCINYKIRFRHDDIPKTIIHINKEPRKITHVLKSIIEKSNQQQDSSFNPHQLDYAYSFLFNTDSGSHNNTEIINGILKLKAGESSGSWTSAVRKVLSNVSVFQLKLIGETLTGASVEITADNGLNYDNINNNGKIYPTQTGKNIRVRVTLSNLDTQLDSLNLLYKL